MLTPVKSGMARTSYKWISTEEVLSKSWNSRLLPKTAMAQSRGPLPAKKADWMNGQRANSRNQVLSGLVYTNINMYTVYLYIYMCVML